MNATISQVAGSRPEDTAANTTVLVPGTGNSVRDRYFTRPDGLDVYKETQKAERGNSNAVVMWMGYDAPDSPIDPRIAQTGLARQGAAMLAPDVNAFEATNAGDAHVTVIGHLYGSTTVADGAVVGMRSDDVVLVGSPGTDLAKSAADFNLPEGGQVYVGAASTDPVTHFGGMQVPVSPVPAGPCQSPLPELGIPVGLGNDPAVDGFGSTRFKAEVPGVNANPFHDHSQYFVPGSESLYAIADITSGSGARLEEHGMTARHRGEFVFDESVDPELFRKPTSGHYH